MFETKEIYKAAQGIAPYLTETYQLLHRHPEVAHREAGTNRLLRAELDRLGVSYLAPADNITIAAGCPARASVSGATRTHCPCRRKPACPMPRRTRA